MKRRFNITLSLIFLFTSINTFHSQEKYDESLENYNPNFNTFGTKYYYSPGDTIRILLNNPWWNIKTIFDVTVYRITDPEQFISKQYIYHGNRFSVVGTDSTNLQSVMKITDSFKWKANVRKDTIKHNIIKKDIRYSIQDTFVYVPKTKGIFLVKFSFRKKISYHGFIVTSIGLVTQTANNSVLCFTADRKTGEIIDTVNLSYFFAGQKKGEGITSSGLHRYLFNDSDKIILKKLGGFITLVIATKEDDVSLSDPNMFFNFSQDNYTCYTYTNQPVYRPPAKVDFKTVVRGLTENGYENYLNKKVLVIIKDAKETEIYRKVLTTNDYGSITDSVLIESDFPLGAYKIITELGFDESAKDTLGQDETATESPAMYSFTSNFYVEEYKKPEYKVEVKTEKEQFTNNDLISFDVKADYYFGSPVQDADVTYKIFKQQLYKPWWYFSEYRWMYEDYYANEKASYSNSVFVYEGKTKLDKEGKVNILYTINEDFKEKYSWSDEYYETDYIYIIQAIVRDKSRRNIASEKTVYVTRSDFYLVSKTDKYLYKPEEKIGVQVYAADFADKLADCNYQISIFKHEQVGKKKKKTVMRFVSSLSGKSYKTGAGTVFFDPQGEGSYVIEVTSFDSRQRMIKHSTSCYVSAGKSWWWGKQSGAVDIITDKDSYYPGEVCHALIAAGHENAQLLITSKNNNILSYKVVQLEGTSMYVDIPIEESFAPNFEVNVSYIRDGNFFNNKKAVLVIPEKKILQLSVSSDKTIYKPREEGTFTLKVTDKDGNPVKDTEVSVGMIDESIYAIKNEFTKDIKSFFYGHRNYEAFNFYNYDVYGGYSSSYYPSLFEKFNMKTIAKEELATVRGKFMNWKGEGITGAKIMIDSTYIAATTVKDGEFDFKIPEGKYTISVLIDDELLGGSFQFNLAKGEKEYFRIKSDWSKLLYVFSDRRDVIIEYSENIFLDTTFSEIDIIRNRNKIATDQSGKIITENILSYSSVFLDKIENISAKTSGIVLDERGGIINIRGGRTNEFGILVEETYVEAETRSDFKDAVFWSSSVVTDENGEAQVKIKFPDNLTTWRITARAITKDTKVNQTSYTVTERKDLIVRVETPRFFQQRDELILSTIVHNYLNEDKQTKVSLKLDNLLLDGMQNEQTIKLGKNEERRIDWKVKVSEPFGFAKVYASALTNEESDATENVIPIQPYGLKISNEQSFELSKTNGSVTRTFEIPENTDLRSASLQIGISPSITASLLSSLNSLIGYPYGCIEQTMSRFIPTVVTAKILKDLNAPISSYIETFLPKMVKRGFNKINSLQHEDGGWGWWNNDKSELFMSAYVVYGLSLAKQSGYKPNQDVYNKGINFLLSSLNKKKINLTTKAFMIYALSNCDSVKAETLKPQIELLNEESPNNYGLALLSLASANIGAKELQRDLLDKLVRNSSSDENGYYWGGKVKKYSWQEDNIQTTAMTVKAMLADAERINVHKEIIEGAVNWLMYRRNGSGWGNTLHNAIINYALSDYVRATKENEADYDLKIFVNNSAVDERHISREDIFKNEQYVNVLGINLRAGENNIRVEKNGIGKGYFNMRAVYYTNEKRIVTRENGFEIKREYYKLKKIYDYKENKITFRKEKFDGIIKSGEEIFVKVKVIPDSSHSQYFMLEDPIPAGCEIIREDWSYQIEGENYYSGNYSSNWLWWYAEKEYHDNRVVFFATDLYGEQYEFSYLLRAEIPGTFNVMPSTGALMYYPDISGSSKDLKIKIEDIK